MSRIPWRKVKCDLGSDTQPKCSTQTVNSFSWLQYCSHHQTGLCSAVACCSAAVGTVPLIMGLYNNLSKIVLAFISVHGEPPPPTYMDSLIFLVHCVCLLSPVLKLIRFPAHFFAWLHNVMYVFFMLNKRDWKRLGSCGDILPWMTAEWSSNIHDQQMTMWSSFIKIGRRDMMTYRATHPQLKILMNLALDLVQHPVSSFFRQYLYWHRTRTHAEQTGQSTHAEKAVQSTQRWVLHGCPSYSLLSQPM